MKKILFLFSLSIFILGITMWGYSDEILTFSKDTILLEGPDDVFYITITNQSSKETILYDIDKFPDYLIIDPIEGKIFPLGEERITVRARKNIKIPEGEDEIVFIYAKKSNPRSLAYKRLKVVIHTPVPTPTPTFTPIPTPTHTPTPIPTPIPTFTPVPTPTFTPTPLPVPTSIPTQTPTPMPTPRSIKIRSLGVVGERPLIYREGIGFVPLKDEIAKGEKIKLKAILEDSILSSLSGLSWETDPETEIIDTEGDWGEVVIIKHNSLGKGHIICRIFDKNGNIVGEGYYEFHVTVDPDAISNIQKVREEIRKKLQKAKELYDKRDLENAKMLYNEVLSIDPENKDAKYGISRVEKAERTQKKAISMYKKAKYYLSKGDIKNAYNQVINIGNYMWAFPKDDPWRNKVSAIKKKVLSLYNPLLTKIKKYKSPGTNIYIYTGTSSNISIFSKKLGRLIWKEVEIPGFDSRFSFYLYENGIIVKELTTGRWEGLYKDKNRTYSLDLAFLKLLTVNRKLLKDLGKGRTPGIFLFKGRVKVQIFDRGVLVEETKTKTIWYKVY